MILKQGLGRKKKLLKIMPYKQQLTRGCGPASLLMAMHFFSPEEFPLKVIKEQEIYDEAKFKEEGSTSLPGLALYALKQGFCAKYYTNYEIPKRPKNYAQDDYDKNIKVYKKHKAEARELGLIEKIGDFRLQDIILEELYRDRPIICLIKLGSEEVTHNVLVRGHKSNRICFLDPLEGVYKVKLFSFFEKDMELSFFKAALVIWRD